MLNDMRIIGVKLEAQKVVLSQKFMHREICATYRLRHR